MKEAQNILLKELDSKIILYVYIDTSIMIESKYNKKENIIYLKRTGEIELHGILDNIK
jgi:hypothetical protein